MHRPRHQDNNPLKHQTPSSISMHHWYHLRGLEDWCNKTNLILSKLCILMSDSSPFKLFHQHWISNSSNLKCSKTQWEWEEDLPGSTWEIKCGNSNNNKILSWLEPWTPIHTIPWCKVIPSKLNNSLVQIWWWVAVPAWVKGTPLWARYPLSNSSSLSISIQTWAWCPIRWWALSNNNS